jgi:hypothetical protein
MRMYLNFLYYSHVMFLMLFSYVILCDYFPLYEFQSDQCFSSKKEHNDSRISINNVENKSTLNLSKTNLTISENFSSKSNLHLHRKPSTTELILIFWVFTLFCEEIRQVKRHFFCFLSILEFLFD